MARAMRPGGLLVITAPVRESLKGVLTKLTPHSFHVWYYKYLLRWPGAGKPGHNPFQTHLRPAMSRKAILNFAKENGLATRFAAVFVTDIYDRIQKHSKPAYALVKAAGAIAETLTLKKIRADITDFALVLRKESTL